MEYFLKKEQFYKYLKSFAKNKHTNIFFFLDFGTENQYTICFSWDAKTINGKDNYIASCQLYDNRKSGARKYITKDLIFDMRKEHINTDYKLYIFLREWTQKNIVRYECPINRYLEDCKDCGYCENIK